MNYEQFCEATLTAGEYETRQRVKWRMFYGLVDSSISVVILVHEAASTLSVTNLRDTQRT